jgi:hypothetical protein
LRVFSLWDESCKVGLSEVIRSSPEPRPVMYLSRRGGIQHGKCCVQFAFSDCDDDRSVDTRSSVSGSNSLVKPNLAPRNGEKAREKAGNAKKQMLSSSAFGKECAKSPQN